MYYLTFFSQKTIESYPSITEHKPYLKKGIFHPKGLYSEQIFGPVKDYECRCGLMSGKLYEGNICPNCNVKITSSYERFLTFGKIELLYRVMHPYILPFFFKEFGSTFMKSVVNGSKYCVVSNGRLVESDIDDPLSGTGAQFIYDNFNKLKFKTKNLKKFIKTYKDECFPKYLPVLPVGIRNMVKVGKDIVIDDINNIYVQIIKKNEISKKVSIFQKSMFKEYYEIQKFTFELFKKIESKLPKKKGLIRQNLLGKRADFSSRAVIAPDPDLKITEVGLPLVMCKELYKFHILSYLINKKDMPLLDAFDKFQSLTDEEYFDILEPFLKTSVVILNRQPTLHRLSMIAFQPRVVKGNAITIPVLVCPPFNADFDGDQMAVYLPLSESAIEEVRSTMLADKQIISPSDNDVTYLPGHDIVLGLYKITKSEPDPNIAVTMKNHTLDELLKLDFNLSVNYKGHITTVGRVLFNKLLYERPEFINRPVGKKELYSILRSEEMRPVLQDSLELIREYGFRVTSLMGSSFSLSDFIIPELNEKKKQIKDIRDMSAIEDLQKEMVKHFEKISVFDMVKSGARGNWDQIRQIALFKGLVSDVEGNIQPKPIVHSLVDGLTPQEFFRSSYGSRKGAVDSSLNTGVSGHLTRKLVFALSPAIIDFNNDDCGTTRYLSIIVTKEMLPFLKGRFIKSGEKDVEVIDPNKYLGKKILLRSPIYCEGKNGLCKKCCGDFKYGSQIGILAAQAMGEKATQMTLRTFHTGGDAQSSLGSILEKFKSPKLFFENNVLIAAKPGTLTIVSSDVESLDPELIDDVAGNDFDKQCIISFGKEKIIVDYLPEMEVFATGKFNEGEALLRLDLQNQDIITDLRQISLLIDRKDITSSFTGKSMFTLFSKLIEIYKNYGVINFIYFEVLCSQLFYSDGEQLRFSGNVYPDEVKTISTVPLKTSIMQGLSFERFKDAVILSLSYVKDNNMPENKVPSILERILLLDF